MRRAENLPDPAGSAPTRRVAELESENARLRQELAAAERRGERLLTELQHRVRNVLFVIRSIARRTALTSETREDYAMHLDGRLGAIARAQAIAMRDPAAGVCLDELIAEELLAHAAREGEQLRLSGPLLRLRAKAAETISLALHELATNAVKFGALAGPDGRIAVTWRVEPEATDEAVPSLRLEWTESGVPLATGGPLADDRPRRRGFGTELIERTLAYELGAEAALEFGPGGIRCTIVLPLAEHVAVPNA